MSEATAVIFGALIGAGGAIVAQVTTAIATARRDRSRLDWEKQQQNREWDVREEERFLAIKQEQYAKFGAAVSDFLEYMDPWRRQNYHVPPAREQPDLEPLSLITANIELVAPEEVSRPALLCISHITNFIRPEDAEAVTADDLREDYDEARSAWQDARYAMRRDLHGYSRRRKGSAPGGVDVPPDPPSTLASN